MQRTNRPPNTVLAATDFSPGAGETVARAALLSTAHDAQLVMMNVVDPDPYCPRTVYLSCRSSRSAAYQSDTELGCIRCLWHETEFMWNLNSGLLFRLPCSWPRLRA